MQRDRGFNFKLLVPPRVDSGQIFAVRPQEIVENSGGFMHTLQQGYSKCLDKEPSTPFSNTSMIVPTKPTRPDVPKTRVVPPMEKEEINCRPGQLYSKLFDEVEKIKCWKVKVDSETVQRERRVQENKRTIETQRKAIQELQFGNESLSIKLEEEISENEDLRNKNNATRNLCNILKDTFQRSAEKIHLFETEREETHGLFMENNESIQRMIAAFESLRIQAESDRHEMQKVKEGLLQFEDLNAKFEQEYNMKQEEVVLLQTKLKDKDNEVQAILLNLHETQENCKQLQEAAKQNYELLQNSRNEQESLLQKLQSAEQLCKETKENREAIAAALEQSKEEYAQINLKKDSSLEELNKVKEQQAGKLVEIQATVQELKNTLTLEIHRAKELELKLTMIDKELERKSTVLGEIIEHNAKKDEQIKMLENELDIKSKSVDSLKGKIEVTETRVQELTANLARKNEEAQLFKNKNEIVSAEKNLLEKACEEAEKAHKDLKEKAKMTEIKVQEMDDQLSIEMKKNKGSVLQMEQLKSKIMQHEVKYEELLSRFNELRFEKNAIQELVESGSSEAKTLEAQLKASEAKEINITREMKRLEEENQHLREEVTSLNTRIQEQCQETENFQRSIEESREDLQEEVQKKEKQIKAVETKLCNLKARFEAKSKAQEECQKENKILKKHISKANEKTSQLEDEINNLKEEFDNIKRTNEEEHKKLLEDLGSKTTFAAELQKEVQNLKLAAAEAIKNKEVAELKCQNKIADMVALMEKHKNQYDRMVEEKDAELDEKKRRVMEADAIRASLELELSHNKIEKDHLKVQRKKEMTETENLLSELDELKKEISSMKISQQSEATSKEFPESNSKEMRCPETPKETSLKRHVFDLSKTKSRDQRSATPKINVTEDEVMKTPTSSTINRVRATPKVKETETGAVKTSSWRTTNRVGATSQIKEIESEGVKTPSWSTTNRTASTPKIKSYRIRTPPSTEKSAPWRRSTLDLDPKSDSSEQNDILTFADAPKPSSLTAQRIINMFKKTQSPVVHKSPGNALKLAAMKRMRDAGWTAVTGSDKKKKKTTEKIFA